MAYLIGRIDAGETPPAHAIIVGKAELRAMQRARAVELWAEGLTKKAIAKILGITPSQIDKWAMRDRAAFPLREGGADPVQRAAAESQMRAAAELWAQDRTCRVIAATLGVSAGTVSAWTAQRRDLFPPRKPRDDGSPLPAEARAPQRLAYVPPAPPEETTGIADLAADLDPPDGPIPLIRLTASTCRWPVDGDGATTLFCGCRVRPGAIYCETHRGRAYGGGA